RHTGWGRLPTVVHDQRSRQSGCHGSRLRTTSNRGCCCRVKNAAAEANGWPRAKSRRRYGNAASNLYDAHIRMGSEGMVSIDRKDTDGRTMGVAASKDGTKLASWRSGTGPALVLVHGTAMDHSQWDGVVPDLARGFSVYALDRRGRGASGD